MNRISGENSQKANICMIRIPEGEEKQSKIKKKKEFDKIMAENSPNLVGDKPTDSRSRVNSI